MQENEHEAIKVIENQYQFTKLQATALNNRSWVYMFRGYYDASIALQYEIRIIYEELDDARGLAFTKTNTAWALINLNEKAKAIDLLEEALETFETLGDRQLTAFTVCIKSLTASEAQIVPILEKTISIFSDIGDSWGRGLSFQFLANHYFKHKKIADADAMLKSSFEVRRRIDDKWGLVQCHLLKGHIYNHFKNMFEAQRHLTKAFQIAEQMQTPGLLKDILVLQGQIELAQGYEEKSKIRFQNAAIEAKKQGATVLKSFIDKYKSVLKALNVEQVYFES